MLWFVQGVWFHNNGGIAIDLPISSLTGLLAVNVIKVLPKPNSTSKSLAQGGYDFTYSYQLTFVFGWGMRIKTEKQHWYWNIYVLTNIL